MNTVIFSERLVKIEEFKFNFQFLWPSYCFVLVVMRQYIGNHRQWIRMRAKVKVLLNTAIQSFSVLFVFYMLKFLCSMQWQKFFCSQASSFRHEEGKLLSQDSTDNDQWRCFERCCPALTWTGQGHCNNPWWPTNLANSHATILQNQWFHWFGTGQVLNSR